MNFFISPIHKIKKLILGIVQIEIPIFIVDFSNIFLIISFYRQFIKSKIALNIVQIEIPIFIVDFSSILLKISSHRQFTKSKIILDTFKLKFQFSFSIFLVLLSLSKKKLVKLLYLHNYTKSMNFSEEKLYLLKA